MRDVGIESELSNFIKGFCDDLYSLELLLFFSRHPNARFNRAAVLHAINAKQFETGLSLKQLVDKKMVVTYSENGIILYGLTKEEPAHSLASQLINIDQYQWQIILEHLLNSEGIQ